jgi:hypothetical protein
MCAYLETGILHVLCYQSYIWTENKSQTVTTVQPDEADEMVIDTWMRT